MFKVSYSKNVIAEFETENAIDYQVSYVSNFSVYDRDIVRTDK